MPATVEPMAATLSATLPPDDDAWGYEVKRDGVRTIARIRDGKLRLTSRSLRDVTGTYPEIGPLGDALAGRWVILDGEIVALDAQNRPSFQLAHILRSSVDSASYEYAQIPGSGIRVPPALPAVQPCRSATAVSRALSAPVDKSCAVGGGT